MGLPVPPMKQRLLLALVLLCASCSAQALDSFSLEAGHGSHETNMAGVGLQWQGHTKWFEHTNWHIAHYLELTFGGWNAEEDTVYDLGFTPVFRFVRSRGQPYFEAAIGFHVLSDLDFKDGVQTSTHFQFGDHIGAGFVHGRYDFGVRLQHLSNGGLKPPNPGINFAVLRLAYHFY